MCKSFQMFLHTYILFYLLSTHLGLKNSASFCHGTLKWILEKKMSCILSQISLKFVTKGPIKSKSALVEVNVWRRTGDSINFELQKAICE